MAGKYALVFTKKKTTALVLKPGEKYDPSSEEKIQHGAFHSRRLTTADEDKKLDNGEYLRVDKNGKTPDDPDYEGHKKTGRGPSKAAQAKAKRTKAKNAKS